MTKKFHWGHGIAVFYVIFVIAVVTALIASFGVDHSLVVDDYYAQDLAYQSTYDKISNSIKSDAVQVLVKDGEVEIVFSNQERVSGNIKFYRPSDKSKDFSYPIMNLTESINTAQLSKGKWKLKIDWTDGEKAFYKEETIYI